MQPLAVRAPPTQAARKSSSPIYSADLRVSPDTFRRPAANDAPMPDSSYAVVWDDGEHPPTTGHLLVIAGHVILTGNSPGEPRLREFNRSDVEAAEVVRRPEGRLRGRPTLALALRDGSFLRVSELIGFGIVGEIAEALA
jgi:hypothetical protein